MVKQPPLFAMTDHDEMTGCAAWDGPWSRRIQVSEQVRLAILAGINTPPRRPEDDPPIIVTAIQCDRCGARGIPNQANWCPRCGRGGNGWALAERVPLHAMGSWRRV